MSEKKLDSLAFATFILLFLLHFIALLSSRIHHQPKPTDLLHPPSAADNRSQTHLHSFEDAGNSAAANCVV